MSSITVETSGLTRASAHLRDVGEGCGVLQRGLAQTQWLPANTWQTAAAGEIALAAGQAELVVGDMWLAVSTATALSEHLMQAADWYERADEQVLQGIEAVSDSVVVTAVTGIVGIGVAGGVGLVPMLFGPAAPVLFAGGAIAAILGPQRLSELWEANDQRLANPLTVLLVRMGVSAGDELANHALGGAPVFRDPQQVAGALADILGGTAGPMRVDARARQHPAGPVTSIADLTASIPDTQADHNATITQYVRPDGSMVYLVSIAGTSSTGFGGENGMDNLSNLAAYAGSDAQSLAAVKAAMAQAGVRSGDEVVFAGYSQGALIAAQLAKSRQWQTSSVLLAGAPMHGNDIGGDMPVTQLEHSGDLITGLQGLTTGPHTNVTIVHRDPFSGGAPAEADILAPHHLAEYRETAADYDAEAASAATRAAALAPLAGARAVATHDYSFRRDEPGASTPPSSSNSAPDIAKKLLDPARRGPLGLHDPLISEPFFDPARGGIRHDPPAGPLAPLIPQHGQVPAGSQPEQDAVGQPGDSATVWLGGARLGGVGAPQPAR